MLTNFFQIQKLKGYFIIENTFVIDILIIRISSIVLPFYYGLALELSNQNILEKSFYYFIFLIYSILISIIKFKFLLNKKKIEHVKIKKRILFFIFCFGITYIGFYYILSLMLLKIILILAFLTIVTNYCKIFYRENRKIFIIFQSIDNLVSSSGPIIIWIINGNNGLNSLIAIKLLFLISWFLSLIDSFFLNLLDKKKLSIYHDFSCQNLFFSIEKKDKIKLFKQYWILFCLFLLLFILDILSKRYVIFLLILININIINLYYINKFSNKNLLKLLYANTMIKWITYFSIEPTV